MIITSYIY